MQQWSLSRAGAYQPCFWEPPFPPFLLDLHVLTNSVCDAQSFQQAQRLQVQKLSFSNGSIWHARCCEVCEEVLTCRWQVWRLCFTVRTSYVAVSSQWAFVSGTWRDLSVELTPRGQADQGGKDHNTRHCRSVQVSKTALVWSRLSDKSGWELDVVHFTLARIVYGFLVRQAEFTTWRSLFLPAEDCSVGSDLHSILPPWFKSRINW